MSNSWKTMTVEDMGKALSRYKPFIAVVASVLAIALVLPGRGGDDTKLDAGSQGVALNGNAADPGRGGDVAGSGDATGLGVNGDGTVNAANQAAGGGGGGATGRAGTTGRSGSGSTGATGTGTDAPIAKPASVGANCDQATGRIKVPTKFAPPCVAPYSGTNGGSTYTGVTDKTITIVFYRPKADAATQAALTAAGASNSPEDTLETLTKYHEYFEKNYETYGRKTVLKVKDGSGDATLDGPARADAIDIATSMKPFAVYGGTAINAFTSEIAARKIVCICTVSQPQEYYEKVAPYAGYTTLMASTEGYTHRAEYVGKRLAGKKAKFAGTRDVTTNMSSENRVFGLLYFETADKSYRPGIDFFIKELKGKYNTTLKEVLEFQYPLTQVQEQAGALISKLKAAGVNSVIFSGDPLSPAIFTQEATRQRWFPEWIVTGSALTDTTLFARTYDQDQWSRAFGLSFLTARFPQEQGDAYNLHQWQHGTAPKANNTYGVIYTGPFILFTGIHLAGANLTPQSFQKGLFSYPPTGRGALTANHVSWGNHGIWPFTDYTAYDDTVEVWWDRTATGPDEVGNNAAGMYRYVDGGKRYLPGTHPSTEPRVFDPNGSPTIYSERPAADRSPQYPRPGT